jgi:hypothetical protein
MAAAAVADMVVVAADLVVAEAAQAVDVLTAWAVAVTDHADHAVPVDLPAAKQCLGGSGTAPDLSIKTASNEAAFTLANRQN